MKKRTKTPKKRSARKKSLGRYASSIEKYCATQPKEHKISFDYEEHTFELMEKFNYPNKYFKMTPKRKDMADRTGRAVLPIKYTPDFVGKDHKWIIETKGYLPSHHDFSMRWKLFLHYLVGIKSDYILFIARNSSQVDQAIQEIKKSISDGEI